MTVNEALESLQRAVLAGDGDLPLIIEVGASGITYDYLYISGESKKVSDDNTLQGAVLEMMPSDKYIPIYI